MFGAQPFASVPFGAQAAIVGAVRGLNVHTTTVTRYGPVTEVVRRAGATTVHG